MTSDKTENDWEPNKAQGIYGLGEGERVLKLQQIFGSLRLELRCRDINEIRIDAGMK